MKRKEIKLELTRIDTFEEIWELLKKCPCKFGYRNLRNKILESALQLSDKLYQTEMIFSERLHVRLEEMTLIQILEQTKDKLKLRAYCEYSKKRFPAIYLQILKKREKLADEHRDFDEAIKIATDAEFYPKVQNHVLLLAIILAATRENCREILRIAKVDTSSHEKAFTKMNRLNR